MGKMTEVTFVHEENAQSLMMMTPLGTVIVPTLPPGHWIKVEKALL
jgi:hypothetical protein